MRIEEMYMAFDSLISLEIDPKIAANWLTTVIAGYLNMLLSNKYHVIRVLPVV